MMIFVTSKKCPIGLSLPKRYDLIDITIILASGIAPDLQKSSQIQKNHKNIRRSYVKDR
jgi:hypothetical protein